MEAFEKALWCALTMIGWSDRSKARLVMYVHFNDSGSPAGTLFSQDATAAETGISENTVRTHFLELIAARVLVMPTPARGSRARALRVHRRFDDWIVPWMNANPAIDARAPACRALAIERLKAVMYPPQVPKPGFVARPGARQMPFAAQTGESLFDASRAPGRATNGVAAARPGARQHSAPIAPDTIPSNSEPLSLTQEGNEGGSEQAEMLLATIGLRAGAPIWGAPAKRVRYIVETEPERLDELVAAVHSAPPGLAVSAYVEIVSQAGARARLAELAKRSPVAEWRLPEDEPGAPPPWIAAGVTREEWAATGAVSCETATGGGT